MMKRLIIGVSGLLACVFAGHGVSAQEDRGGTGTGAEAGMGGGVGTEVVYLYRELLSRREGLGRAEDSTLKVLAQVRRAFAEGVEGAGAAGDVGRGVIGEQIRRLEGELFALREQLGRTNARIAEMEQEYASAGGILPMEGLGAEQDRELGRDRRTLFYNAFFEQHLPKNEVALFALTPKVEPRVMQMDVAIRDIYTRLEQVKGQYEAAMGQDQVDSLALLASALKEQIERQDAMLERQWLTLYRRKIDHYPVLIDQIGHIDRTKRELLDQESRLVRRAEGLAAGQLAPLVAAFPLQKRLALNYEIIMAEALGLRLALDSLLAEYQRTPQADAMSYPDIPFPPRSLVLYSAIQKGGGESYARMEDVPMLQLPRLGIYYAIQLSIYTNPPAVTVFKGMSPLRRRRLADGRMQYVAGGFRKYAQAQQALGQMQRAGFRAPTLVAWVDGVQTTGAKAKALEEKAAAAAMSGEGYGVNIVPGQGRLSADLREIIAAHTADNPAISIVRHATADGQGVVYSVGNFGSKSQADRLAQDLSGQADVRIEVVEVE